MFDNVVVGATDSAGGTRAVRRAIAIVRASGGTLHIVTANRRRRSRLPEVPAELRCGTGVGPAGVLLGKLREMAMSESVRVQTHPASSDPVEAITRVAAEENADLIVVGSKVSKGIRQLADVPKAVMDRAACPVLVV